MFNLLCNPRLIELRSGMQRVRAAYLRRSPDRRRISQYRSQFYGELWRDAASHLGATVEDLGSNILQIQRGPSCTRVCYNTTSIDDPVTLALSRNKLLVYQLLAHRQLRVPAHCEFTLHEIDKAAAFVRQMGGACVVKPAVGSGGYAVTTGITGISQLIRGIVGAAAYCSSFVLEQQVKGDVYRLLYLDGELLDAVLRGRPTVIGDGKSSVRELVRGENQRRAKTGPSLAHDALSIDGDMCHTLATQGMRLSSVPEKGEVVTLKTVINQNSQPDNRSATHLLCKSIIDDGAAAAQAVGIRLAGVDVITPDPGVPLSDSGGAITDINPSPGLHYHYYRRDGGCPVARSILPRLLSQPQYGALRSRAEVA